jgi:hypothetical protein
MQRIRVRVRQGDGLAYRNYAAVYERHDERDADERREAERRPQVATLAVKATEPAVVQRSGRDGEHHGPTERR